MLQVVVVVKNVFTEFEEKYTTLKGLFLGSREKPQRKHEEGTKSDILSCERSLDQKNNKKGNEHYVRTLSIKKLCTEDLNGKNEDACATSIKVHIISDENVEFYHFQSKGVEEIMKRYVSYKRKNYFPYNYLTITQ